MRFLLLAGALALTGCLSLGTQPQALELPRLGFPLDVGDAVRIDGGQPAREPAIAQAPDGALYVAGFWGQYRYGERAPGSLANLLSTPLLWKSADGGGSWQRLDPGLPAQGALGNSDVDLAVDGAGTVYIVSLTYLREATLLAAGASRDGGESWTWTLLDRGPAPGRPWVEAGPGGEVHAVWDHGGVRHAITSDGGATWGEGPMVHGAGSAGGFAVGPGGELAVRVAPASGVGVHARFTPAADGVAVSEDGGLTWSLRPYPAQLDWDDQETPRAFDPLGIDAAGTLYTSWAEGETLFLARSLDLAASWDAFPVVREPGVPYYAFLRAGAPSQVALTWFTNLTGSVAARVALVEQAQGASPVVHLGTFAADTGGSDHAEYFQPALLREGGVGAPVPMTSGGQWLDYRVAR